MIKLFMVSIMSRTGYFHKTVNIFVSTCTYGFCEIFQEWADHDVQNLATYFMLLGSICFNIFVICYIGELLTEQVLGTC